MTAPVRPAWPQSKANLTDFQQTRAPAILIGNLIPFLVATIFEFGRIYARAGLLRHLGLDDYLLLVGWLSALINCILACLGTLYGEGMHKADISLSYVVPALRLNYATRLCYQASFCFTKLSICVFYLRVFGTTKATRYHVHAIIAFVVAYTIPLEVTAILSCNPPKKVWEPSTPGYCLDAMIGFWTSFACNTISDIWIIVFAARKVWALKMQRTQKMALVGTLTLGWIVVIAGVIRVSRISSILHATDTTWVSYDSSIWSSLEINTSIVCAAAPALKPIFKRYMPGFMYSISGKTSRGKPSHDDRSTWVKASSKNGTAFEMGRNFARNNLTSQSQEELARSVGRKMDISGSGDELDSEEGEGITKSTHVTISHWPVRNSGSEA